MREAFHDQLDSIFDDLADDLRGGAEGGRQRHQALLTGDAEMAEEVISADALIDRARERVEDTAFSLLSLQQPVAGDLRVVVSALRMVSELERMGDLSVHVAKIARLRVPQIAVPEEVRPTVARMAEVAEDMVAPGAEIITERDVEAAIALAATTRRWTSCGAQLHPAALRRLGPRRRGGRRHRPARPLLRADRRPRRLGGQPRGVRGHRPVPGHAERTARRRAQTKVSPTSAGGVYRGSRRDCQRQRRQRPWLATAAAAAAASGSRYSPPATGAQVLVEAVEQRHARWGC